MIGNMSDEAPSIIVTAIATGITAGIWSITVLLITYFFAYLATHGDIEDIFTLVNRVRERADLIYFEVSHFLRRATRLMVAAYKLRTKSNKKKFIDRAAQTPPLPAEKPRSIEKSHPVKDTTALLAAGEPRDLASYDELYEIWKDHLECAICLRPHENPVALTCMHSFCKECIEKMMETMGGTSQVMACPMCRKTTYINNIGRLAKNWYLEEVNEKVSLFHTKMGRLLITPSSRQ